MKQIRKMVFETNSSSSHSISISRGNTGLSPSNLKINDDHKIEVGLGGYGWGYDVLYSQYDKLSYLLTMAFMTEIQHSHKDGVEKKLTDTNGFRLLDKTIREHANCDGIYFDNSSIQYDAKFEYYVYNDDDGYIDHQSCEFSSLEDFLNEHGVTAEEFIFNSKYNMIIDNDNH